MPRALASWVQELPRATQCLLHLTLARLAELAELWPPGDWRWARFGRRHSDGLTFYVDGCCVRVHFQQGTRCLGVQQIGRVRVRLPASEGWAPLGLVPGSAVEH